MKRYSSPSGVVDAALITRVIIHVWALSGEHSLILTADRDEIAVPENWPAITGAAEGGYLVRDLLGALSYVPAAAFSLSYVLQDTP